MSHLPPATLVEIANAWHHLAEYQRELDEAAAAACSRVPLEAFGDEDPARISARIEERLDGVALYVTLWDTQVESFRAWATPDLVLLRATTTDGRPVERLVRLPFPVETEGVEVQRHGERFRIELERRTAVPHALFPPIPA